MNKSKTTSNKENKKITTTNIKINNNKINNNINKNLSYFSEGNKFDKYSLSKKKLIKKRFNINYRNRWRTKCGKLIPKFKFGRIW